MLSGVRNFPQSPYRQPAARRREATGPREPSAGVVTCLVVLLFILAEALSAEPPPGDSFAGLDARGSIDNYGPRMSGWPTAPSSKRSARAFDHPRVSAR
jgi:hypothetical protein